MNFDSSKRKVEQISFRKYSRYDAGRVTDINSIYPCQVKTCFMSIAQTKAQISLPAQSEQHPLFRFFDNRISTDVKASLIILKLECQSDRQMQLVSVAEEAGLNFTWSA